MKAGILQLQFDFKAVMAALHYPFIVMLRGSFITTTLQMGRNAHWQCRGLLIMYICMNSFEIRSYFSTLGPSSASIMSCSE